MPQIDTETGEIYVDPKTGDKMPFVDVSGPNAYEKIGKVIEDHFALEPSEPGKIPERVIDELRGARTIAKDHAQAFSDCIKAQAEKYGIKPGALKRYIVALCEDKVEEVENETDDLQRLIGSAE